MAKTPGVTLDHRRSSDIMPVYMYFQTMATPNHSLRQNYPPELKRREHLPETDAVMIQHEVAIMPHRRVSYGAEDLIKRPHGSSPVLDKQRYDDSLDAHGIPHVTIHNGGNRGVIDLVDSLGLFVVYPNYHGYRRVPDIDGGEDAVLYYVLSTAEKLVVDKSRGGDNASSSFNKRVRWGVGQIQQVGRRDNRQYSQRTRHVTVGEGKHGASQEKVPVPTMTAKAYLDLPLRAREFIKNIAEFGQKQLRRFHGETALANIRRNKLFSRRLNRLMGQCDMLANFEYYDVVVTDSEAELQRHMDYGNDWRAGYNHTFIHSFFREINGKVYKVSVIMTTRRDAGAAFDRIASDRSLSIPKD